MSGDPISLVGVGDLARWLNLTEVRVQQLAKLGVVARTTRGQYDLQASVSGYIRYLQQGNSGASGLEGEEGEVTGDDYHKHRARLYKARADAAELEADLIKGKLHDAEKVAKVWIDMIASSRSKLLGMKKRAAGRVKGMTDLAQIEAVLEETVHEALNELSDYDPSLVSIDPLPQDQPEVEASAQAEREPMG